MGKAIIIEKFGDVSGLKVVNTRVAKPKKNQIQIKHTFIEITSADIFQRKGELEINNKVNIPGTAAMGEVVAIGEEVSEFSVGDRVGYATALGGSYCQIRNIDATHVFSIPKRLSDETAASCMYKGFVMHMLVARTTRVYESMGVLVTDATSSIGKLLCTWCNVAGAFVVGAVDSNKKIDEAKKFGAHEVINYKTHSLSNQMNRLSGGFGINAIYDSIGKDIFDEAIASLNNIGIYAIYNQSSGYIDSVPADVFKKAIFITAPNIFDYKKSSSEIKRTAHEFFQNVKDNGLNPDAPVIFDFDDVAEAHNNFEENSMNNSVILRCF